jgi:hypothetical protein
MLNDADGYQGGGNAGDKAHEAVGDAEALFSKLKRWIKTDYNSKGQVNRRKEAREISTSTPATSSTRKIRRSCRTQSVRSSFSTA